MMLVRVLGVTAVVIALIGVLAVSMYFYHTAFDHRFATVTEGRVYRSGAMPYDLLTRRVERHGIKSVIDFRTIDATPDEERSALASVGARYFHVPAGQLPPDHRIDAFLEIMDDEDNYPVLLHCTHGEGRAPLFAAIYRIEIEGWEPEKARRSARWFADFTAFAKAGRKGRYLLDYVPRGQRSPIGAPPGQYAGGASDAP